MSLIDVEQVIPTKHPIRPIKPRGLLGAARGKIRINGDLTKPTLS